MLNAWPTVVSVHLRVKGRTACRSILSNGCFLLYCLLDLGSENCVCARERGGGRERLFVLFAFSFSFLFFLCYCLCRELFYRMSIWWSCIVILLVFLTCNHVKHKVYMTLICRWPFTQLVTDSGDMHRHLILNCIWISGENLFVGVSSTTVFFFLTRFLDWIGHCQNQVQPSSP